MTTLVLLVLCSFVIAFGSSLVFRQLLAIARKLRVPPFFVASLLLAFSTSLPELLIGITSAARGEPEFALGNIIGANILGLTLISGTILLFSKRAILLGKYIDRWRLMLTFAVASLPVPMLFGGGISRGDGFVLIAIYLFYVIFSIRARTSESEREESAPRGAIRGNVAIFLLGALLLVAASQFLFFIAHSVSMTLGLSALVVGIFVLSFSTTLPEMTFGLRSLFKHKPELALADVIGANAVNATAILGLTALIHPIGGSDIHAAALNGLFMIMVYLLFYLLLAKNKTTPLRGAVLVFFYALFACLNLLWAL